MTRKEAMLLMIGDYVEYEAEMSGDNSWWNVGMVRAIQLLNTPYPIQLQDGCWYKPEDIRPIKTTPELLAKNGFAPKQAGMYKTHWMKRGITIVQTEEKFYLPCWLNEDIDVSEFHRLQQAIRLINGKELVL